MRLGAQPVPPEVLEALRERALASSATLNANVSITGLASSCGHALDLLLGRLVGRLPRRVTWISLPARTSVDVGEAERAQRAANRQALRVVDRRLEHDAHFGHATVRSRA